VRQGRVAGAQDQVDLHVLAQLVVQDRPHLDLGQHAEALGLERVAHAGHGLSERGLRADMLMP